MVIDMTNGYFIQAKAASGGFTFNTVTGLSGPGKFTFGVGQSAIPHGNNSVSQISFPHRAKRTVSTR